MVYICVYMCIYGKMRNSVQQHCIANRQHTHWLFPPNETV